MDIPHEWCCIGDTHVLWRWWEYCELAAVGCELTLVVGTDALPECVWDVCGLEHLSVVDVVVWVQRSCCLFIA